MKADQPTRGRKRVEVGAACKKGKHRKCFVQDCSCSCHPEEGK